MTDRCRSCVAAIVWGTNINSRKSMPIDPDPSPRGNVSRYDAADGPRFVVLTALKADAMRAAGKPLYLSHFATCPHADLWKRDHPDA